MPVIKTKEVLDKIVAILEKAREDIVAQMRKNGQYVTGKTASGIKCYGVQTATHINAYMEAPISLLTLETGRRAGKIPYGFQSILFKWSIDKHMQFKTVTARKSFAWYTARKIASEGSWIYRQGFRVDVYTSILRKATHDIEALLLGYGWIDKDFKMQLPTTTLKQTL